MAKKKATKKAAKKPAKKAKKTNEVIVVQSKFKEALKAHDVNVASDALEGANAVIHWYLEQAAERAKANGRKTVRAHDFTV